MPDSFDRDVILDTNIDVILGVTKEEPMDSAMTRTTIALPADLLARVDEAVHAGKARSRNSLVAAALRRELAAIERAEIDASFEGMAEDAEYQAEVDQLMKEFAQADLEAWRLAEDRA
jgi:metal-responsive CopG/Arc/MetJ family transcriptional regulator